MSVTGYPEAQRGVPPLTSHITKRVHIVVVLSYHKVEAEQDHDCSNSRVQACMARQRQSRLSEYRTPLE